MIKLWAWLVLHGLAVALAAVVIGLLAFGIGSCRDKASSAEAARLVGELKADTAEKKLMQAQHSQDSATVAETRRQLDVSLANGTKVITAWRDAAPAPIRVGTAHDSVTQLAKQVKECRDNGDALVKSEVQIQTACAAHRDSTAKMAAHDSARYKQLETSYAHLDSLAGIYKRGKRVQPYGDLLYEPLKQRPVVGVGGTANLFWNLDAKADLQYAIPRPKPDSTDGFRLFAGAHIRF